MATYERQIDALGGVDPDQTGEYNDGYSTALHLAMQIGADADDTINELLDCLGELLNGDFASIARWGENAALLVDRVGRRLA
jgi:hypothetical protein